jgi:hypothetical protein
MKYTNQFFLIFLIVLIGCGQNDLPMDSQVTTTNAIQVNTAEKNAFLDDYALMLASAIRNDDLRALIRSNALRKFDGDYNVLVKTLESEQLNESEGSVKELMTRVRSEKAFRMRSAYLTDTNVDESDKTSLIPNLQISVPIHCEDWDTKTFIPLVAVLPYDYKELPGNRITAYDADGKAYLLSADQEPDFPVLVVSRSERVNEKGELDTAGLLIELPTLQASRMLRNTSAVLEYPKTLTLTHGFAKSLVLEWEDVINETGYEVWRMSGTTFQKIAETTYNDNNFIDVNLTPNAKYWYKIRAFNADGFTSWSPIMATTASNRSDNEWLKIKRMRFSSSALKAVESWILGAPEIRLRVVQGSEGGATNVFTSGLLEPDSRGDINEKWWEREVTIFSWSTSVYGTVLTFDWREEDWWDKVDFTLNGSYEDKKAGGTVKVGGTVTFKNDDGGDVIGNTSVMWWQEKSQIYDLSGFQWQFTY